MLYSYQWGITSYDCDLTFYGYNARPESNTDEIAGTYSLMYFKTYF